MSVESSVRALAGSLVLSSLVLFAWLGPWALLVTAFVGVNLVQSAFTGFCPAEMIFKRLGVGRKQSLETPTQ